MIRRASVRQLAAAGAAVVISAGSGFAQVDAAAGTIMARRPKVVAFDVIETLFDPAPLDPALEKLGLPPASMKVWFPRFLRDAFALEIAGEFKPFAEVASGSLKALLAGKGIKATDESIQGALGVFASLKAHPDVRDGCTLLRSAGVRMLTLTNGNAGVTGQMLKGAGLDEFMEQSISIDEVQHWKPGREVYLHAARAMKVAPAEMAMIAAHDWDTAGAKRAGLVTGGVIRGAEFSAALPAPDVIARSLPEVVRQLLALPA